LVLNGKQIEILLVLSGYCGIKNYVLRCAHMRKIVFAFSCFALFFIQKNSVIAQQAIPWPLTLPTRPTLPLSVPNQGGYLVSWSAYIGGPTGNSSSLNLSAVPLTARFNISKFIPSSAWGAGGNISVAIKSGDGRVIVWSGSSGWMGMSSSTEMPVPNEAMSDVADIVVLSYMQPCILALKKGGVLVAWNPSSGELAELPSELQSGIVSICGSGDGANSILALKSSGQVFQAEANYGGGSTAGGMFPGGAYSPTQSISFSLKNVPEIARARVVKIGFTCVPGIASQMPYVLKENGEVVSWEGYNGNIISLPPELNTNVVDFCGYAALFLNGSVLEWDSMGNIKSSTPSILNSNVSAISAAIWSNYAMALTKDGNLISWETSTGTIHPLPVGLEAGVVAFGVSYNLQWVLSAQGKAFLWSQPGAGLSQVIEAPGPIQGGILRFYTSGNSATPSYFAITTEEQAVSVYCGLPLDILADLVARRIGLRPMDYGLAPKAYVDDVAGTAQARGVASVTQNPRTYDLYTHSEYQTSQASGVNAVLSSPNTWSLYSAGQIQDMSIGNPVLTKNQNGTFILNYDIEQSDDLKTWTPYRVKAEELTGLPTDKAFVRIKAKQ